MVLGDVSAWHDRKECGQWQCEVGLQKKNRERCERQRSIIAVEKVCPGWLNGSFQKKSSDIFYCCLCILASPFPLRAKKNSRSVNLYSDHSVQYLMD